VGEGSVETSFYPTKKVEVEDFSHRGRMLRPAWGLAVRHNPFQLPLWAIVGLTLRGDWLDSIAWIATFDLMEAFSYAAMIICSSEAPISRIKRKSSAIAATTFRPALHHKPATQGHGTFESILASILYNPSRYPPEKLHHTPLQSHAW